MGARSYRDLIVWQKAMDFVEDVYEMTKEFPREEQFSLTSQLRRSAISIPSNIAEGEGRFSKADFNHFLSIAHGSVCEAETQTLLANRLRYIGCSMADDLLERSAEVGRLIRGLSKSLRAK